MENIIKTKRVKRLYIKKGLLTQDELWKAIIPFLWAPFLRFCLEDWADKIDFSRKPMIDEDPANLPTDYSQSFGKTAVHFTFPMFKLLDNPPPYHGKEDNPFSIVFEVAWRALKQHRLKTDEDLMSLKYRLIKRLLQNETDGETIYAIFDFINIYLPFGDKEKSATFERELDSFIDKEKNMTPLTMRDLRDIHVREQERWAIQRELKEERKLMRQEAKLTQQAAERKQQTAERKQQAAERKQQAAEGKLLSMMLELHKEGFSLEKIASMTGQSVEAIQDMMAQKS